MNIGERIKKRREDLGLTLEDVGIYIGVNKATVQRYETGNIDIKRNIAIKLSEILRTTPAYVMGWSDTVERQDTSPQLLPSEQKLLDDFRNLNKQGQEYILQTMDMVKDKYKKLDNPSVLENVTAG